MAEQFVRINGKTLLYKQKAPFVASGMSIQGGIEYDAEEDKLRCHECGEWFKSLGPHIWQAHGISGRDYKSKHALMMGSSLVNENMRLIASRTMAAMNSADPEACRKRISNLLNRGRGSRVHRLRAELRNERRTCPAQLLADIRKLASKLGHTPSQTELSQAKMSGRSACLALNVKTIGAVVSLAGLVPNGSSHFLYTPEVLIEILRDFYVSHGRLPRQRTDHNRGLLPSCPTFRRAFGSMKQAFRAAGLGLVAAAEGGA